MRHILAAFGLALAGLAASPSEAATLQQATVSLGGPQLLSTLTVANGPGSTAPITEVVYSFGGAATGIATFYNDTIPETFSPGSTRNNFWVALPLDDPGFLQAWQTSTWSGLGIGAGSQQVFSGISVRLIAGFIPPTVSADVDGAGTSLANGSITVRWGDGAVASVDLKEQS